MRAGILLTLSLGAVLSGVASYSPAEAASPPSAKPWAAPASVVTIEERVSIASKGAQLEGTLYLPQRHGPVAAIVVTHGASSPLRSSPLYQHLKTILPAIGIAVFVYDRRGTGASTGRSNTGDFPLLADDAISAVEVLRHDRRIDPRRVGVWGLSQGGWLSLLAAAQSRDVAFAVSISAPLVTPDVQMMFSSTNTLRVYGYGDADIAEMRAARKAVDDYMRGSDTRAHAQALVDAAKDKPWFKYLYMGRTIGDRETSGWRKEISFDPAQIIETIHVPTLILYGAADPVVPVATSTERLKSLLPGHPDLVVDVIAGADHGMQMAVDPKDLLDPEKADAEHPDSEEYFATLSSWLTKIGMTTGPDR